MPARNFFALRLLVPTAAEMMAREFFKNRARGHALGFGVRGLARPRREAHGGFTFATDAHMVCDERAETRSVVARQAEREARQEILSVSARGEIFAA